MKPPTECHGLARHQQETAARSTHARRPLGSTPLLVLLLALTWAGAAFAAEPAPIVPSPPAPAPASESEPAVAPTSAPRDSVDSAEEAVGKKDAPEAEDDGVALPPADTPLGRFFREIENAPNVPADQRRFLLEEWAGCADCDPAQFLTQALVLRSPDWAQGLDAYEAGDYERCIEIMHRLAEAPSQDAFVQVHAAVYEIKALAELERFAEVQDRIGALLSDSGIRLEERSYFPAEIAFLDGYALLADLEYDAAMLALSRFLRAYPNAPLRLRLSAEQMLAELDQRQTGRIGEVADLMTFSARRLEVGDTGSQVQGRQEKIVALLDKLIEDAEEAEKGGGGGANSGNNGAPNAPMPKEMLPQGGTGEEGVLRESRWARPGDAWGAMPPAERERVLQALRESFPPRYRALVEQYYEELAKQP
jgi:tetratricopeptide (TPR) repeat protein